MHGDTIFFIPYGSRVGFAIEPLVRAFVQASLALNGKERSSAHLAFTDIVDVKEAESRFGTHHLVAFDATTAARSEYERMHAYLRRHRVRLAMLLDVQPASPFVRFLRRAGVSCVLGYWGAEISSRGSFLKQLLKILTVRVPSPYRVDGLIFESKAMARIAVEARGCPASMIEVVNTGVDPTRFAERGSTPYVHETFDLPLNKKIVVYAGHAHERKGIGALMDAAVSLVCRRKRSDLLFLICGNRPHETEEWLHRIAGTGAESSVLFAGYRSDMPKILTHADVGVVPSSGWDSFPMTALEMQAAGLPLVASRLGGIPETLVAGNTALLVEPGDSDDLAEKIEYLVDRPDECRRLGINGRRHVTANLTVAHQVARLAEVFERRLRATSLSRREDAAAETSKAGMIADARQHRTTAHQA